MTRIFLKCLVVFGVVAVALTLAPNVFAQCGDSLAVKHIRFEAKWTGLDDNELNSTLSGRVFFLLTDLNGDGIDDLNNGTADFFCKATSQTNAGGQCQGAAGGFGDPDGSVTLNGNWAANGVNIPNPPGCPILTNNGDAPVCAYVTSEFGSQRRYILGSTGYDAFLGLYAWENAQPSDVLGSHQIPRITILPSSVLPAPATGGTAQLNIEWSAAIKDDDCIQGRDTCIGIRCPVTYRIYRKDNLSCLSAPAETSPGSWTAIGSPIDESDQHCQLSTGIPCGSSDECPIDPATGMSERCVGTASVSATYSANQCAYLAVGINTGGVAGSIVSTPKSVDARDNDGDGVKNAVDNCPNLSNANQLDADHDGVGDVCDNCGKTGTRLVSNPEQDDTDTDGVGDSCDNCPNASNTSQVDTDSDGVGDACDNCPNLASVSQADADGDGRGDVCDNCPNDSNANQADSDHACVGGPTPGDHCVVSADCGPGGSCTMVGDGVGDACDNCKDVVNPKVGGSQPDTDQDGIGDVCDNCPANANPALVCSTDTTLACLSDATCPNGGKCGQLDTDFDTVGDICDNCPTIPNKNQDPAACTQFCTDVTISFGSPDGRGSGVVVFRTSLEKDLVGFNVITLDGKGTRTQQNTALIRCEECITGVGHTYSFIIPKHKSGHNIFVEMLRIPGSVELCGPATRQ